MRQSNLVSILSQATFVTILFATGPAGSGSLALGDVSRNNPNDVINLSYDIYRQLDRVAHRLTSTQLRQIQTDLTRIQAVLDGGSGGSGRLGPEVSFYQSDRCSSSLVGMMKFYSDPYRNQQLCADVTSSTAVWGVAFNGTCIDISDTTMANACRLFQPHPEGKAVTYYQSDRCTGSVVAHLTFSSDATANREVCRQAERGTNTAVWGIKIDGESCIDIVDAPFPAACRLFQVASEGVDVTFHQSDRCSGSIVARVTMGSDPIANGEICDDLGTQSSASVWGVNIKGQGCRDVVDGDLKSICHQFKYVGTN